MNNFAIKDFSYNPDEINQYSMSRIIGLGLSLLKNDYLEDNSLSRDFIAQSFSFNKFVEQENKDKKNIENEKDIEDKKDIKKRTVSNLMDSLNKLNVENTKIKVGLKSKIDEKREELPPLPNQKTKDKAEAKSKIDEKKKELPPLPNLKIKDKAEAKSKNDEKKKELPPLPNLKINENTQMNKKGLPNNEEKLNKKENKSFKMDKSFLKDD